MKATQEAPFCVYRVFVVHLKTVNRQPSIVRLLTHFVLFSPVPCVHKNVHCCPRTREDNNLPIGGGCLFLSLAILRFRGSSKVRRLSTSTSTIPGDPRDSHGHVFLCKLPAKGIKAPLAFTFRSILLSKRPVFLTLLPNTHVFRPCSAMQIASPL